MKTLLLIQSSLYSNDGQSGRPAAQFAAAAPAPHLTAERFQAFLAGPAQRPRGRGPGRVACPRAGCGRDAGW